MTQILCRTGRENSVFECVLPAFLMTVDLLPYRMIVFYMYFANNVANPIIYSFMNHNFRAHLKHLICRHRRRSTVIN